MVTTNANHWFDFWPWPCRVLPSYGYEQSTHTDTVNRHCRHTDAPQNTPARTVFSVPSLFVGDRERERERERESACVCVCRCPGAHNNSVDAMGAWSICVCFSSVVLLVLLLVYYHCVYVSAPWYYWYYWYYYLLLLLLLVLLVLLVLPALEVYWHNWHYWQVTIGTTGGWWLYAFYLRNPKAPYCHQRWVDTPVNRLTLFPSPSLLALLAGQVRLLLVLLVAGGCMHSICGTQRPRIVIKGGLTLR